MNAVFSHGWIHEGVTELGNKVAELASELVPGHASHTIVGLPHVPLCDHPLGAHLDLC